MNTETRVGLFIIIGVGIFLYLSIHIGEIKLNKNEHSVYKAYFDETGGLEGKSPVKIAGVSVGWVDNISLLPGGKAEITMRVQSIHKLGKNAFARVSQEGLIGSKAIEIDPGDSSSGYLPPGSTLPMPGRAPTTVNGLLEHFKDISTNIGEVTHSMKTLLTTAEAEGRIKNTIRNAHDTSEHLTSFTRKADELLTNNKDHINVSAENIRSATSNIDDVAGKINRGKGLIGKLVNEDEIYTDVQKTVKGIRTYVNKTQNIRIKLDGHVENMTTNSDRKGYFSASIFTYSDYFYMIEIMSGKIGKIERQTIERKYYDASGEEFTHIAASDSANFAGRTPYEMAAKVVEIKSSPSKTAFNIQVGKRFDDLTFRTGLFDETFGVAIDYNIPTHSEYFGWKMSVEAFDFWGHNRTNGDGRMHVKWINKISYMNNIYSVFGMDDFFSKSTASPFLGIGLTFDDDDLKYILPGLMSLK